MIPKKVEDWTAQVNGSLDGVILACTSMLAKHPEKDEVFSLLNGFLKSHAQDEEGDNPQTQHYKLGIREAISKIASCTEAARISEDINSLKGQSGSHQ